MTAVFRWLAIIGSGVAGIGALVSGVKHLIFSEHNRDPMFWVISLPVLVVVSGSLLGVASGLLFRWYRLLAVTCMTAAGFVLYVLLIHAVRVFKEMGTMDDLMEHPSLWTGWNLVLLLAPFVVTGWAFLSGLMALFRLIDKHEGRGAHRTWGAGTASPQDDEPAGTGQEKDGS